MPQETAYTRQIMPRAAEPMPLTTPEQYGAGLARQVGEIASQAHRQGLEDYKIQRQKTAAEEAAAFQHGFALHRENMAGIAREARKSDEPGHAERMATAWDAARESLLSQITDDEVRRQATAQFEDTRTRFVTGEADFEDVAATNRALLDWSSAENIARNRIRRLEKPEDYPAELELGRQAIAGLHLPPAQEKKALAEWGDAAAVSFIQGQIDRDPAMARAMIDKGVFDEVDPDKLDQLRNVADVEIRRQQAAAEHASNLEQSEFRQTVRTVQARAANGQDVSEDLPALVQQAEALKLPDVAEQLRGMAGEAVFARIYEKQTPTQREARQRELEAILPDKRTAAQAQELKWLEDHKGGLDSEFNKNPVDFFINNGGPSAPPPLDGPGGIQRRVEWARATAEAVGRPVPPLSSNEAAQLQASFATGQTAPVRQVVEQLALFPADAAAAAARQVAPDDPTLEATVTLGPSARNLALRGRDALKANPKLLAPVIAGTTEKDLDLEEQLQALDAGLGEALRVLSPRMRDAVLETAHRIAAGLIDEKGGKLSAQRYGLAINMALGARMDAKGKQLGGMARWGEHWFAIPPHLGRNDFAPAVARAAARMRVKPVNPDKTPADLSRAYPVAIGGGLYEFHTANGDQAVLGSDGKPWRVKP